MPESKKTIGIHFGALALSLKKQLKEQGITVTKKEIEHFQKDADAVVRLSIRGILPDSIINSARNKLFKKIVKFLEGRKKPHGR